MDKPPLIVLGLDCMNGLQCARIAWRRGIPVIGVARDARSPYCRTRAVREIVPETSWGDDPRPALRRWRERYGGRPVLLATTDEHVWWIDRERDRLAEEADFIHAPSRALELLADKAQLYRHALAQGLPLPETRFVADRVGLEAAAREMVFPLVVKPPRRDGAWMEATGGLKVLKVDERGELVSRCEPLLSRTSELILQGWIHGSDQEMHSLYACFDRRGEQLAALVARKIRQWPPDVGVGSLAVTLDEPRVEAIAHPLLTSVGFTGLACFQAKRDALNGRFYIIEINAGRPGLGMPITEAAGIEMLYLYYCAAAGLPLPESRSVRHAGAKWICWKTDLASAYRHWRRGDLTPSDWWRSIRGRKWSADFQGDDLRPALLDLLSKLPESGKRIQRGGT